jgi:hypothetical protein
VNFTEEELDKYNDYMNFIRRHIIEESLTKFKLKIKEEQIELGHIKKEGDKWKFYYDIENDYKSQFEVWKGSNKRSGMTTHISYYEWKLIEVKENRDRRITELLSGLDTTEKIKLGI